MASDTPQTGQDQPTPDFFISPGDRDMMIRMTIAEAGREPDVGKVAVAHSILNRVQAGRYGGDNPTAVITAPWQYEPWTKRRNEVLGYDTDSPAYNRTAALVDGVLSGDIPDPTGGRTHFYSPGGQRAMGRSDPSWGNGPTALPIYNHVFSAPEGLVTSYASSKSKPDVPSPANPAAAGAIGAPAMPKPAASAKSGMMQPSEPAARDLSDDDIERMLTGGVAGKSTGKAAGGLSGSPGTSDDPGPLTVTVRPSGAIPAASDTAGKPAPADDPAKMSDSDIEKMLLGGAGGQRGGQTSPATAAAAKPPAPGWGQSIADGVGSFAAGAMDLPIVGPALTNGLTRAAAGIRSYRTGESYDDALSGVRNKLTQITDDHPYSNIAGNVFGNVAALAPIAATGPGAAAFGITGGNMLLRGAAGAATGAALGGADTAVREATPQGSALPTNLLGVDSSNVGIGAAKGGLVGGAAVPIGAVVGYGVNRVLGRGSATAPVANVNQILDAAGMSPQEAKATLQRMGPQATIADLDPALTMEAGALAARGGKPTSILRNAMSERAAGADSRISQVVDDALGPKPDLTAQLEAAQQRASAYAKPYYDAARNTRDGFNLDPIIANIDSRLNTAAGGTADVLSKVRSFLVTKDGLPKVAPQSVLEARQAIDDLVERLPQASTSAGKNARAALKDVRGQVDAELKSDPNIAAGDAHFAGEMKLKDALQEGTELFQRGTRTEDFARRLASATPDEVDALRSGARIAIGDLMEQARRGELAGAKSLLGAGSANRAKFQMIYPKADTVLDALQSEAAMRATESRVAANSATAERQAAALRYQPPGSAPATNDLMAVAGSVAAGDPTGGVGPALLMRGVRGIRGRMQAGAYDNLAEGTAARLGATGDPRDAFMNELIRVAGQRGDPGLAANIGTNLLVNSVGADNRRRVSTHKYPAINGR